MGVYSKIPLKKNPFSEGFFFYAFYYNIAIYKKYVLKYKLGMKNAIYNSVRIK